MPGKGIVIKKNYMLLYSGHKSGKHEVGTGFYISRQSMVNLLDFGPVNKRICKIWVKLKHHNLTLISTHAPTEETNEVAKEKFYCSLEKVCDAFSNSDMKRVLQDFNTEVGKQSYLYPTFGGNSLHNKTNDNGK
jgi:hypothetical protein